LLLEAISKINDPELKVSMLHKLRKMLNKKEATKDDKLPKPTISLFETLERFNKLKPKKVNLEDLQSEINQIKKEIIQLKAVNEQLESQNAKLEGKNAKLEDRVSVLELDKIFKPINNDDSSSEDDKPESSSRRMIKSDDEIRYCNLLNKITPVRWHTNVKLIIEDHEIEVIILVDTEVT
jgi:predicted nuclease with TOPRIM domain